ncbi:MAG: type I polyketide synthase, partial [Chloroflexi bacterium]
LGRGQVVSSQGRCESFGQGADGYVPAEGVGAVLLKPLSQAEADGDHIYGVIKATAINHGGKTNGYTVPNPHAQAAVIGQALREAGIDPRTITYIEAHGTGTVLGDPIEIAGLTSAFAAGLQDHAASGKAVAQDTQASGWCAIGSVKSNIGHAESAAGIAGVTKVLLQMRYGQLVPSLHTEVLNPHIDFATTPFVVQRELSVWKRPLLPGADGEQEHPRRAGMSSFGAGGSNAHVILEEYRPHDQHAYPAGDRQRNSFHPAIITLSARTEEQLHERVWQLLDWIRESSLYANGPTDTERDLASLAYTLQVGREPMEERLALQVASVQELEEKLSRYISAAKDEDGDWYRGQVKRNDLVGTFAADEDGQKTISAWMSKGKYEKLLSWWVKGLAIDWKLLYTVETGAEPHTISTVPLLPRRISLPTYPFARQRYWLPTTILSSTASPRPSSFVPLHPLVQRNTSTLWEQRFSSVFHGDEFFLADHIIRVPVSLPQRYCVGTSSRLRSCTARCRMHHTLSTRGWDHFLYHQPRYCARYYVWHYNWSGASLDPTQSLG